MPEKLYIIEHNEAALHGGDPHLSDQLVDHHLNYLKSDIENCFTGKSIDVVVDLQGKRAHITLKSKAEGIDFDNELGPCLKKINERTPGLAFVKVE